MECGGLRRKRVVVHQSQVAPLGEGMAPETGCLLACGVPTGLGAVVNTARVRPGETVVVIGAGGVGLNAVQGARLAGAGADRRRWTSNPPSWRTPYCLRRDRHDPRDRPQAVEGAGAPSPAGGWPIHVFVTVGAIPAYDVALRLMAPGGTRLRGGHAAHRARPRPMSP